MIKRDVEPTILTLLKGFPIVTVTGPRQSGKTTLAKHVFRDKPYISLEDPDARRLAVDDPRAFLSRLPNGGVLDEIQRAPEILSYLQSRVDADKRMGMFLLTGSQQFGLLSYITQSLAGRTGFIELLPFSMHELHRASIAPENLDEMMYRGGYPPIYDRDLSPSQWLSAYVTAYVERDVRQLVQIQNLDAFQKFVMLCAGRSGQIVNFSSLANDCGITHNTVRAWISVLESSYILFQLRPHHVNFNKRLIKAPKLYFYDVGLACWLLGIREPGQLMSHPLRGNIFETLIVSELVKSRLNTGEKTAFHFWRDSNGNEIDIIADVGLKLMPIEIKSGQTLNRDFFSSMNRWLKLAGDKAISPSLVYGGTEKHVRKGINIYGWNEVSQIGCRI